MSFLVVDASVFGSNLLPSEDAHAASAGFLRAARERGETLVLPLVLLTEVGGIIGRRLGRPELTTPLLNHLLQARHIRLADFERRQAMASADLAAHARLRAADAIYVTLAIELGATLVTLDRQQLERAASRIDVATPSEMLRRWEGGSERAHGQDPAH